MKTTEVFALPECSKQEDQSLLDIRSNISPIFREADLAGIFSALPQRSLSGKSFQVGLIPVNYLKSNGFFSTVVYLINSITALRNTLIVGKFSGITESLSMLVKKMHNQMSFKSHVCPHEFIYQVSVFSKSKFSVGGKGDAQVFFQWLVNRLIDEKYLKTQIKQTLQGRLLLKRKPKKFLLLKLDLPPESPFSEDNEKIYLKDLLDSYIHKSEIEILKYPNTLILMINKFRHNKFFLEKSKAQVIFDRTLKIGLERFELQNLVSLSSSKEKSFNSLVKFKDQWFHIDDLSVSPVAESSIQLFDPYILLYFKLTN
jgi:U4/U6.U5 tri-snRNP-associated protein 2